MSNPRALVVFDLDGTLLRSLTGCEVLAHSLGRLQRMQEMGRLRDRPQIAAARGDGNLVSSTLHGYSRCVVVAGRTVILQLARDGVKLDPNLSKRVKFHAHAKR